MKARGRLGAIALAMPLALVAAPASGAGPFGHRGIVVVERAPSAFPRPVDPWKVWGLVNQRRLFIRRSPAVFGSPGFVGSFGFSSFAPYAVSAPPMVDYAPPSDVYTPPVYAPPVQSNVYIPSALSTPAVAPPSPTPAIVEYPSGRYELRGDGMTVPYVWVWIPRVPPPPPEAPPSPAAESQPPPGPAATAPAPRPSTESGEAFSWTDEQGVTHWTNKLNKIPERYRSRAQRIS